MAKYRFLAPLIGLALVAGGLTASAAANDFHFSIRNSSDTADVTYDLPVNDTRTKFIAMHGADATPKTYDVGEDFYFDDINQQMRLNTPLASYKIQGLDDVIASDAGKASASTVSSLSSTVSSHTSSISTLNTKVNAIPLIQRIATSTDSSGNLTWTFPTSFGSSTPVVTVVAEDNTSGALTNVQITAKSATSVTVHSNRITTVLGLLTLTTNPSVTVDITAVSQ